MNFLYVVLAVKICNFKHLMIWIVIKIYLIKIVKIPVMNEQLLSVINYIGNTLIPIENIYTKTL